MANFAMLAELRNSQKRDENLCVDENERFDMFEVLGVKFLGKVGDCVGLLQLSDLCYGQ